MMSNELVSIILPFYNGEKFLADSISSCLGQSYRNIELILINDCSTDSSLEIAQNFAAKDNRVRVFSNESNLQLPASLNIGHTFAAGKYYTWTSDDNLFHPNAIEIMVSEINRTTADIVFADFDIIEDDGKFRRKFTLNKNAILLLENIVGACFLYKKEVYERNNGYDVRLHTVEDYDFWLQASRHSSFYHIQRTLYSYRSHRNSLSAGLNRKNSKEEVLFNQRLIISYEKFFCSFGFDDAKKDALFFSDLHRHKKIEISFFLLNFENFKQKLIEIQNKTRYFKSKKVLEGIDVRLRNCIQVNSNNQNLKTLYLIVIKRPQVLLNYDRTRSLKLVLKCAKLF